MIIHQPKIVVEGKNVIVSSRIETKSTIPLPKELWFKFPLDYKDAVTDRADSFFSTLFLLGMHLNEDINVRGDISPKLAENILDFSELFIRNRKRFISKINYSFDSIQAPDPGLKRTMRIASFSGGVDSFYCLWSHQFPKISKHPTKITHGLFIHGFDLLLQNQENYQSLFSTYKTLFNQMGLSLINCSTNAYSFYQFRISWIYGLIPTLAGTVSALGNKAISYIQPGSWDPDMENSTDPGSHIHLLSTETLDLKPHAIELDRVIKLKNMIDWAPPQKHLRICLNMGNESGIYACQRCEKCLNTSFIVNLFNKQDLFPPYDKKFTYAKLLKLCWITADIHVYTKRSYMRILWEKRQYRRILIIWMMVPINSIKKFISSKVIPILPRYLVYSIKKLVYNINEFPKEDLS